MSFMKKMTNMLKSGRVPDLKTVTKMASDSLKERNQKSPFARREITDSMLTPAQLQISRLQWDWRNASQSWNKGSGNAIRNWEQPLDGTASEDLFLVWQPADQEVAHYVLVVAWRGWATALIQRDSERFDPSYIDALFEDRFSTQRIVRFDAALAPNHAVRLPASENNGFYYLKLIGETTAGEYVDIADYSLRSAAGRESMDLHPLPSGEIPDIEIPAGTREVNAAEQQFKPKM